MKQATNSTFDFRLSTLDWRVLCFNKHTHTQKSKACLFLSFFWSHSHKHRQDFCSLSTGWWVNKIQQAIDLIGFGQHTQHTAHNNSECLLSIVRAANKACVVLCILSAQRWTSSAFLFSVLSLLLKVAAAAAAAFSLDGERIIGPQFTQLHTNRVERERKK